jgi:hypothetical protein
MERTLGLNTTLKPVLTIADMEGNDVHMTSGYTITYDISKVTEDEQEDLLNTIAYYGYLASEEEPFNDGETRTTKRGCIRIRLYPSNKQKCETHRVTIRDIKENNLHEMLKGKCQLYYMKIRVRDRRAR